MPHPRDRDNDPPRDTARGRGARPRHRDEPGALAATQAPRDTPHPPPPPRAHPLPPSTPPCSQLGPPPTPRGGRKYSTGEPYGGGDPPKKERGSGRAPAPCAPPAPNTARSEVAPALAGAGRPCRGEGAQHGPPAGERHGGTGGLRPARACKQPGWGVNKPLGGPHPGQAPWLSGGRGPRAERSSPGWGSQGPTPPVSVGSLGLRVGVLSPSPSAQHRDPQPCMGALGPSPPLNTGTLSPAEPPSPL